jgi:hypothetical protein
LGFVVALLLLLLSGETREKRERGERKRDARGSFRV